MSFHPSVEAPPSEASSCSVLTSAFGLRFLIERELVQAFSLAQGHVRKECSEKRTRGYIDANAIDTISNQYTNAYDWNIILSHFCSNIAVLFKSYYT